MSQTVPLPPPEEIRRLMHLDWAERVANGGEPLDNIDRAANLCDVVASPYHHLAFRDLSLNRIMLISIYHLMERRQWSQVWRAAAKLHRMELDGMRRARHLDPVTGRPEPAAPAPQAPAPTPQAEAPAPPAPQAQAHAEPPLPPRATLLATSTRDLIALCAERCNLSVADFRQSVSPEPPFT